MTLPADTRAAVDFAIAEAFKRMAPDDYKPMPDRPVTMTTEEEIRMNKQSGYTTFELLVVVIWVVSIGGWIANVVKLFGSIGGEVTTLFILRCVGVLVAPLGVVLGFL